MFIVLRRGGIWRDEVEHSNVHEDWQLACAMSPQQRSIELAVCSGDQRVTVAVTSATGKRDRLKVKKHTTTTDPISTVLVITGVRLWR